PAHAQSDSELRALINQMDELYRAGKFNEAVPLAQRYADAMKVRHGPEHAEYSTALNNLAQLLQATNRYSEAEPLMRRALAIDEKSFGPEHPDVAIRLHNLAALLQATNRYSEAEPLMRRALAIDGHTTSKRNELSASHSNAPDAMRSALAIPKNARV